MIQKSLKYTLQRLWNTQHDITKCKNERCGACNIIIEGKSYIFKNSKTKFIIKKNLSCKSKNIAYKIECNKCKEVYIGPAKAILNYQKIEN